LCFLCFGRRGGAGAAATALPPTCVDAVLSGHEIAAQLSAAIGQSNLTSQQKNSSCFLRKKERQPRINTDGHGQLTSKSGTQEPTAPFPDFLFS
jgi:hypothetical protein